jgi:hypothetical protein
MKSPMHQRPDSEARQMTEDFIAQYSRKTAGAPTAETETATT